MRITDLIYKKRFSLGDYSFSEITLNGILAEKDEVESCIKELKHLADKHLEKRGVEINETLTMKKEIVKEEPKKEEPKKEEPKKEEPKKEEPKKEEPKKEEPKKEEPKKEVDAPAKKTTKKKVVKKKVAKTIAYDRENDNHKADLSELFDTHYTGWRKSKEMILKAKEISMELNGIEMYDSEGKLLETFITTFKEKLD